MKSNNGIMRMKPSKISMTMTKIRKMEEDDMRQRTNKLNKGDQKEDGQRRGEEHRGKEDYFRSDEEGNELKSLEEQTDKLGKGPRVDSDEKGK